MTIGRGKPTKAISQRSAPSEKNQNSSPAQSRCVTVARAKTVKNVWLRIAQAGSKKIAKTNFTQRVGTTSGSEAGTNRVARATLRTIFRPRSGLCFARLVVDLRFFAAKVVRRLRRRRGERKSNPLTPIWKMEFEFAPANHANNADTKSHRRCGEGGSCAPPRDAESKFEVECWMFSTQLFTRGPCRRRCGCRS